MVMQKFRRVSTLMASLTYPVVGLRIRQNSDLTSLQGMPPLPALTAVDFSSTPLQSLQGMPTFPALTVLNVSLSGLNTLRGMPTLPALKSLDLSGSLRLESRQGMPTLPALTKLDVSVSGTEHFARYADTTGPQIARSA
jgi:hypothetical protein